MNPSLILLKVFRTIFITSHFRYIKYRKVRVGLSTIRQWFFDKPYTHPYISHRSYIHPPHPPIGFSSDIPLLFLSLLSILMSLWFTILFYKEVHRVLLKHNTLIVGLVFYLFKFLIKVYENKRFM